jgi:hypothetical protein
MRAIIIAGRRASPRRSTPRARRLRCPRPHANGDALAYSRDDAVEHSRAWGRSPHWAGFDPSTTGRISGVHRGTSTSGRARSGPGAFGSCTRTSRASGNPSGTTCMATPGKSSAIPVTEAGAAVPRRLEWRVAEVSEVVPETSRPSGTPSSHRSRAPQPKREFECYLSVAFTSREM